MHASEDWIELTQLRLDIIVGLLDFERVTPQPVEIDLRLFLSLDVAGDTGSLEDTIDYAAVLAQVRMLAEEGRWRLIESMGLAICALFLCAPEPYEARPQVERVQVRIRKPTILQGAATPGVALTRNADWCVLEHSDTAAGVVVQRLIDPPAGGAWKIHIQPGASWALPSGCAVQVVCGEVQGEEGRLPVGGRIARGRAQTLTNASDTPAVLLSVGRWES